jgi:hypothetical protein
MKDFTADELKRDASLTIELALTIARDTSKLEISAEISNRMEMLIDHIEIIAVQIKHNWTT